jgi:Protein of unknown function (DUF3754)
MAAYTDREHFIPVRCSDLVDVLANDKGLHPDQAMAPADQKRFRHLASLLLDHYHREYHGRLLKLKDAYAPFDPDADTKEIRTLTPQQRQQEQDKLFAEFSSLLERANYHHMTRDEIEMAMEGASYWGIDMSVDWRVFERIEIYFRGQIIGKRTRRHWLKFWQKHDVAVPTFLRMAILLKQKQHRRLGRNADTEHVFLKLFKDIPTMDLEMLLPGTRIRMRLSSRGKLGASILGSIAYVGWKISESIVAVATLSLWALYGPLALVLGYAYKTWSGFTKTKQTYMLQLTQSLYYQNLDNNGGVIYRLLDEAEDQETREALLAYFYLWRYGNERGWTAAELDDFVELDLEKKLNLHVDFEIEDSLGKLERLQLLVRDGDRYRVRPIDVATAKLEDPNPTIGSNEFSLLNCR